MKWVRPCISVMFAVGVLAAFLMGKISSDAFIGIAASVITYWFKSRDDAKKGEK